MIGIFRKLKYNDLEELNNYLLPINKKEVKALTGLTLKDYLLQNKTMFQRSFIWEVDGEIICIYGGVPTGEEASLWLMATDKLEKHKKEFGIWTMKRVMEERKNYKVLHSLVYEKNSLTKRWLSKMGFTILPAEPIGLNGELFHRFEMRS